MRKLYAKHQAKESLVVLQYAEAEENGTVERKKNIRNISSTEYASRLLADGKKKGWIYEI